MYIAAQPSGYDTFCRTFNIESPSRFNFAYDVLDRQARNDPHHPAMVHIDPQGIRRTYDLDYFSSESSRLAQGLSELGLGKGDRVMLILYRRVEFWTAMLALHRIGAVAIPSPAMLTAGDIRFRVDFAGVKGAVVEDSVAPRIDSIRPDCPGLQVLVQAGEAPAPHGWHSYDRVLKLGEEGFTRPERVCGGDDPLLIFFTSGTTGMPKMVEHTHTYPLGHATTGIFWHDLTPGDLHLTLADTGWGKAVWGKFYGQWMAGATVMTWDFRDKFLPSQLLKVMSENKVTSFCAPPTVYRFLVREDLAEHDLSFLRHCTTAGELLNDGVFRAWKRQTGLNIYEGYGQTETCLLIATFPFMEPRPGSIGKPVPGWDVLLLDTDGDPCPPGTEGEICISLKDTRPLGLFTGYLDDPDKTSEVLRHGIYHTGDKAWMDEDGYFWFLGRTDDLIKSSGYRIGPFEVESALVSHPAVVEAAVTSVPDPVRGQAVKATVVLGPGFEPGEDLTRKLQEHVKTVTAPYKYPRVISYVDELPKTISGKIRRVEIREKDWENAGRPA